MGKFKFLSFRSFKIFSRPISSCGIVYFKLDWTYTINLGMPTYKSFPTQCIVRSRPRFLDTREDWLVYILYYNCNMYQKSLKIPKGVIRIRISKNKRQHSGQKKNVQKDKQRSTKHTHKTKDRVRDLRLAHKVYIIAIINCFLMI